MPRKPFERVEPAALCSGRIACIAAGERTATIQSVEEQSAAADIADGADGPDSTAESLAPADERDDGTTSTQRPTRTSADRTSRRRPFLGQTAAVTIIAALIASITLAAVTAFNTLRSDIISVRTELRDEIRSVETGLRDEIAAVRTELRNEIGSLRTELHDFRTEVGAVLLDHAECLALIEALLLNGTIDSSQQS